MNSTPPRITKYRAWTGTEMVAVQTLCFNDKGCLWYARHPHMGWAFVWPEATWTEDDPKPTDDMMKPVMQWTGHNDKLGTNIYEGDILVSSNDGSDGCDTWDEKDLGYGVARIDQYGFGICLDDRREAGYVWSHDDEDSVYNLKYLRVVGNVYANPDLLKS